MLIPANIDFNHKDYSFINNQSTKTADAFTHGTITGNKEIEITKDVVKIARAITLVLIFPLALYHNFKRVIVLYKIKIRTIFFLKRVAHLFKKATDFEKMEIHAALSSANNKIKKANLKLQNKKEPPLPFVKAIHGLSTSIFEMFDNADKKYYTLTYPDNDKFESPEYIIELLNEHKNIPQYPLSNQ